ncbi:hypothetical protein V2W45_1366707, partial [Cenococcum geophilum]
SRMRAIRSNRGAVTCLFVIAVGCKPSRSQAYRRDVLSAGRDSTGVSARCLVVPVQNPSVPVYPQPAAPVST